jgi:hypothetical protein
MSYVLKFLTGLLLLRFIRKAKRQGAKKKDVYSLF